MRNTNEKYYVIPERCSHIGFSLMERLEKGRKEIFYHTSKDVIEYAYKDILNGKFDAKKYPEITISDPKIIKFNEKHGDNYYIYTSREDFYNVFLDVFMDRYREGWYSYTIDKPKQEVTMTLEEINALPDETLKKFQLTRYKEYERELRDYNEFLQLKSDTEKAYKEKNAKLAYYVMHDRKDGEYEGFEIIEPNRA
jgi:hypothetical protein